MGPMDAVRRTLSGSTRRAAWLGHPAFFACVAVLLLNDRVLKAEVPGWWTGKLSDVAGVAMIGVVVSVLVGPRFGLPLAAVAFTVLKTVPGVAETAAPILGGATLRDPTDLLALVVLVPLDRVLAVSARPDPIVAGSRRAASRVGAVLAAMAGSVLVVGATTATACVLPTVVRDLSASGDNLVARVDLQSREIVWAVSDDAGRTWTEAEGPLDGTEGSREVCASDGSCWAVVPQRSITRTDPDGREQVEHALDDDDRAYLARSCGGSDDSILDSVVLIESDAGPVVVTNNGTGGVLVREGDGTWTQVSVLWADEPTRLEPDPISTAARIALVPGGPVLAGVVAVVAIVRRRSAQDVVGAVAVVVLAWLVVLSYAFGSVDMAGIESEATQAAAVVGWAGLLAGTVVGVVLGVRPRRLFPPAPPAGSPPTGDSR